MKNKFYLFLMIGFILCFADISNAQVASGGTFAVEQTALASGGGTSMDTMTGIYRVEGTTGQNAAGTPMFGGNFSQIGGFWTPVFAPTAAGVEVGGRVMMGKNGIRGVIVTITGGSMTAPRVTMTNNFGYFFFENVEVGYTYIVTVSHKKYSFAQSSMAFTLFEAVKNLEFEAIEQN